MPISFRQLLVTTDSRKVSLSPLPGVEWEIELYPDEAEALADKLREAAARVRWPRLARESGDVKALFEGELARWPRAARRAGGGVREPDGGAPGGDGGDGEAEG